MAADPVDAAGGVAGNNMQWKGSAGSGRAGCRASDVIVIKLNWRGGIPECVAGGGPVGISMGLRGMVLDALVADSLKDHAMCR